MNEKDAVYEGPIVITKTGKGFFSYDPEQEDLFIPAEAIAGAFPGDLVKVSITGSYVDPKTREKRKTGKVVEIVSRTREMFVGKLVQEDGRTLLIPDWKKMYVPFAVTGENLPLGHKVVVRFKGWEKDAPYPWGEVSEVIGLAGVHETEMRALALSQGFSSDFPPAVIAEAKKLEEEGDALLAREAASSGRRDFRGVPTFTIDPADAKDFDDALSVRALDDGDVEVGIHIADVSFFVRPGTATDNEARHRATSVYLVDRTIPMLPHVLSTNLCSLNPNVDRLSMSAVFVLDKDATVKERWFGETVIHSDKRFTYEEAQSVLDTQEGPMLTELNTLRALAGNMRKRRIAQGALEFDTAEVKIELDNTGKPIAIRLKERKETSLLIEDFMLLANVAVAEELSLHGKKNNNAPSVYRIHDAPNAERILNLAAFLKVLGYDLPVGPSGEVKGPALNLLLSQTKGKPEEYLVKMAVLRSMAKAVYATKNTGHFGLAFPHYTNFTSPIRRYPDVLVHRMLKHYVASTFVSKKEMEEFDRLAEHSSEREVAAAEAERDSIKMKQVEFMAEKIGQEFDAVISGVTDRGLYVEEKETRADGMIRVSAIGDDYFVYDEKRYRLVGERTKKTYALGDPVRVRLSAARIQERELDFELVASPIKNS
ncbi:ribonuclease R [Candidatus Parcubacteria bacterium]|nr:ribonuclease R [Candidatus Parcubacteria bacterium]